MFMSRIKFICAIKIFLFLFVCRVSAVAQTQQNITNDSMERLIISVPDTQKILLITDLSIRIWKSEPEKTKRYLLKGINLARATHNYEKEAKFLNILGVIHSTQGNYDSASYYYSVELKIGEQHQDKKIIAKSLSNEGLNFFNKSNYDSALYFDLKALTIQEEIGDSLSMAGNLSNIGNLYYRMKSPVEAIKYLNEGLKIYELLHYQSGIANDLNSLGVIYDDMGQTERAIEHYNRSLKIKEELDDKFGIAHTLRNLGDIYSSKGNHKQAFVNYKKALELGMDLEDQEGVSEAMLKIAAELAEEKKYKEANEYADSAFTIACEIENKLIQREAVKSLSDYYSRLGNFQKAYEYHKLFKDFNDSIVNESKNRQVAEIQTKYETEKKEKQNALLSSRIETKEKQLLKEKTKFFVSIGFLFFIVIISVLLYNRNKLKQNKIFSEEMLKQEKLRLKTVILTQETERKRIALELHDGLGQMLSAARLNVAALDGKNENGKNQFNNALTLIDDSCRELRNISHDIMPALLVKSGLISAVEELAAKSGSSSALSIHIDHDENIGRLQQETEINIFRIIQELLNNIIKYAEATEVHIQFIREDQYLSLLMEDNGKGFDKNILATSKGNGWHNIQSRLELIQGTIEIDSQLGNGTVVHIEVPLKKITDSRLNEKA